MDGVLIDTSESYDLCVIATVKKLSGQTIALPDIYSLRKMGGFNNEWILTQQLLSNLGFEFEIEAVTQVFQALYLGSNAQDKNITGYCANEVPLIEQKLTQLIKKIKDVGF